MHFPWSEMLGMMAGFSCITWFINQFVLQYASRYLEGMMSCWTWNGMGNGKEGGSHSQVYTGKLVLLRENWGKVAKDSGVLRKSSFESGLPHPDLRLLYKLHQEGSTSQQNTTANHKMWRISIMCSASDILKPIIFCICSLLACSIYSLFPWSQARDRLR